MEEDRLSACFARLREQGRAAFVTYLCAGDPDFSTSLACCREAIAGGADILELGVPFSDPLADGLTNQLAADRALRAGMTQDRVFDLVRELRRDSEIPIVFYTYYNLVFARGESAYVRQARRAGVDGILVLDLPPEEAADYLRICREEGMRTVFLAAPTTPDERIPVIAEATTGFLYYVSRTGVTGVRDALPDDLGEAVARLRRHTNLPIAVGFGISRREQVEAVSALADAVVVGSALVGQVARHLDSPGQIPKAVGDAVRSLALPPQG